MRTIDDSPTGLSQKNDTPNQAERDLENSNHRFRRHVPLAVKLTIGVVLLVLFAVLAMGTTIYYFESARLKETAENQIEQTVQGLQQMIAQSIAHTIRSQLQATADRNRDITAMFYEQFKTGALTEVEAHTRVREVLLSQKIGQSGYVYVVDSSGTLRVHPKASLVNVNISKYGFVQEQIRRKTGYIEYRWKNPEETEERPKALAMAWFEPWDYIISASAYREDFLSMVDIHSFRADVLKPRFGHTGYAYVIDTKGNLLIHPELEGKNIFQATDVNGRHFIADMCRQKNGKITYPWRNPDETEARDKDVVFRYFPELDIILAGGIYRDELYEPLGDLRFKLFVILAGVLLLSIPAAYFASRTLGRPVLRVSELARRIADRDLRVVDDFDKMTEEAKMGSTWIQRSTAETLVLLNAFREAGMSIRSLLELLNTNAERLAEQRSLLESAASFSNANATEQHLVIDSVAAAVGELKQAFQQTEGFADEMRNVAARVADHVAEGKNAAAEAADVMSVIEGRSDATRIQIAQLSEVVVKIEAMIRMVQEIAAHSQILSVNAGIQAAKAGAAGKGFSVVAAEVRELALQSAKSTADIKELLDRIRRSSKHASLAVDDSCIAVSRGRDSVGRFSSVISALNTAIELNSETASKISDIVLRQSNAVIQISETVRRVESNSTLSTETADKLMRAVDELRSTQEALSLLVVQYRV